MKLTLFASVFLLLALLTQASATTNYNGSASFTTTHAFCLNQQEERILPSARQGSGLLLFER